MDLDMKQVLQMMGEMNAAIQGLTAELRSSIKGVEGRFDGLEGRFDGLEGRFDGLEGRFDGLEGRFDGLESRLDKKFNRLSMEFVRLEHRMDVKFDEAVADMKGIYNKTAWAMDSAKVSSDKVIAHGPMLIDHEDRIRALEGKRKLPPSI